MGDVHYMTGNLEEAMECYRDAYRIRLAKLGTKHVDVAATRNNMGVVYMKRNENEKGKSEAYCVMKLIFLIASTLVPFG